MKKITLISALALGSLFYSTAKAQIRLSLGVHLPGVRIAAQAPVYTNYNAADDYYYLPDVDAYYSVAGQCYYYNDGGSWVSAAYLPGEYRDYDWRNARHYEVREHNPYLNGDFYREKYRGNTGNWARYDNHVDNRAYANRDEYRDNRQRFDSRGQASFSQPSQPNRSENNYSQPERYNRGQGSFSQPSQPNRSENYNRPSQPQRQNNYSQPTQPARGQGQPSRQNGNGQQRGNNAGEQHFSNRESRSGHDRFRS